jgi:hypothetical protein
MNVSAEKFEVFTVPKCDGYIQVSSPIQIANCKLVGNLYQCPCAANQRVIAEGVITKQEKIIVEYYTEKYKNGAYRITKELFINPTQQSQEEAKALSEAEKKALVTAISIPIVIVGIILLFAIAFGYKYYKKLIHSDDD